MGIILKATAIHIKTALWEDIMLQLKTDGWTVYHEYDNYDKGIDVDLIILEKDGERIFFGWTNWFEGEIYGTVSQLEMIERMTGTIFTKGNSEGPLKEEVIRAYKRK